MAHQEVRHFIAALAGHSCHNDTPADSQSWHGHRDVRSPGQSAGVQFLPNLVPVTHDMRDGFQGCLSLVAACEDVDRDEHPPSSGTCTPEKWPEPQYSMEARLAVDPAFHTKCYRSTTCSDANRRTKDQDVVSSTRLGYGYCSPPLATTSVNGDEPIRFLRQVSDAPWSQRAMQQPESRSELGVDADSMLVFDEPLVFLPETPRSGTIGGNACFYRPDPHLNNVSSAIMPGHIKIAYSKPPTRPDDAQSKLARETPTVVFVDLTHLTVKARR